MLLDSLRIMEHAAKHDEDPEFQSLLNELGFGTENAGSHHQLPFSSEQDLLQPTSAFENSAVATPGKKADWSLEWLSDQSGAAKTANASGQNTSAASVRVNDQLPIKTLVKPSQHSPTESQPDLTESSQVQKLKKDIKSRDKFIMELKKLLLEEKELRLARQKQIENHRELLEFKRNYQELLPVYQNAEAELRRMKTEVDAGRALNEQQAALIEMLKKDIVDLKIRTAPERAKISAEVKDLKKQIKLQEEQIDDKNRTIAKLRKFKDENQRQITSSNGGDLMKNMMEKMRQMVADEINKHGNLQDPSVLSACPSQKYGFEQSRSEIEDSESFRLPSKMSTYGDSLAYDGTYSGSTGISLATLSPPSSVENDFVDVHSDQALDEVRTRFSESRNTSDMEVPSKLVVSDNRSKTLRDNDIHYICKASLPSDSYTRFNRSSARAKRNRSGSVVNDQPTIVDTSAGEKFDSSLASLSPVLPDSEVSVTLSPDKKSSNSSDPSKPGNLSLSSVCNNKAQVPGIGSPKSMFDIDDELLSPIRTCVDDAVREFFMSPPRVCRSKSQLSLCSTSSEELVFSQQNSAQPSGTSRRRQNSVAKDVTIPTVNSLSELASNMSTVLSATEKPSTPKKKRKRSAVLSDEELCIPEVKVGRLAKTKILAKSKKMKSTFSAPETQVLSRDKNIVSESVGAFAERNISTVQTEKRDTRRKPAKSMVLDSDSDDNKAELDRSNHVKKCVLPSRRTRNSEAREKIGDPTVLVAVGSGERMCTKKRMELLAKERVGKTSMQLLEKSSAAKIPKINHLSRPKANLPTSGEDDIHMPEAPAKVVVLPSVSQDNESRSGTVADDLQLSSDDESVSSGSSPRKYSSTFISSEESLKENPDFIPNSLPPDTKSTPVVDMPVLLETQKVPERDTSADPPVIPVSKLPLRSCQVTRSNDLDIPTRVKTVPSRIYCTRRSKHIPEEPKSMNESSHSIIESTEQSIDHRVYSTRQSRSKVVPGELTAVDESSDVTREPKEQSIDHRVYSTRQSRSKVVPGELIAVDESSDVTREPKEQSIDHQIYSTRQSRSKTVSNEPVVVDESSDAIRESAEQSVDHIETVVKIGNQLKHVSAPANESVFKKEQSSSVPTYQHLSAKQRIRNSLPIIAVGSGENICDKKKLEMMATKTLSLKKKQMSVSNEVQNVSNSECLSPVMDISGISRVVESRSTSAASNAVVVGVMRGSRAKAVTSQGLKAELRKITRPARTPKFVSTIAPPETVQIKEATAIFQNPNFERESTEQPIVIKGIKNSFNEPVLQGEDRSDQKLLKMLFSKEAKTVDLEAFVREFSGITKYAEFLPMADYLARRLYDYILHDVLDYAMQRTDEKGLVSNSELLSRKLQWLMSAHRKYKTVDVAVASFFICEVLNKEGNIFERDDVLNGVAISYGTVFKIFGLKKIAYEALFLILVRHTPQKHAFSQGFLSAFPDLYAEEIPDDCVLQRGIMLALLCAPLYADSIYHNNVRDILRDGLGQQVVDSDYMSVVPLIWKTSKDVAWSHALIDLEKTLAMLLVQCRWATSQESMELCFHEAYRGWCSGEVTDAAFGSLLNSFVWATELHRSRDSGTERVLKLFDTVIKGKHTGFTSRLYRIVELGRLKLVRLNQNLLQTSNSHYCSHQSMLEQKKDEAKEEKKARRRVKRKIKRATKRQQAEAEAS